MQVTSFAAVFALIAVVGNGVLADPTGYNTYGNGRVALTSAPRPPYVPYQRNGNALTSNDNRNELGNFNPNLRAAIANTYAPKPAATPAQIAKLEERIAALDANFLNNVKMRHPKLFDMYSDEVLSEYFDIPETKMANLRSQYSRMRNRAQSRLPVNNAQGRSNAIPTYNGGSPSKAGQPSKNPNFATPQNTKQPRLQMNSQMNSQKNMKTNTNKGGSSMMQKQKNDINQRVATALKLGVGVAAALGTKVIYDQSQIQGSTVHSAKESMSDKFKEWSNKLFGNEAESANNGAIPSVPEDKRGDGGNDANAAKLKVVTSERNSTEAAKNGTIAADKETANKTNITVTVK